jgi:hypothetical protein
MAIFALLSFFNLGVGPIMAGWIEMNPKLGWKWIQWVPMMYVGFDDNQYRSYHVKMVWGLCPNHFALFP